MDQVIDLVVINMRYNLKTKLSLSYILITVVCVGLISFFANVLLEKQFRQYVLNNQEVKNKEIVNLVSQQYGQNQKWNIDVISSIGVNALENGLIVKVSDNTGKIIWDATLHNSGLCNQMLAHIAQNMNSRYVNWQGKYVETNYLINVGFEQVGNLKIGYYGPFYYNDNDLKFINTLNSFLIATAAFSLLLSLIFGTIMARRLSSPISRVIHTAQMISKGFLGNRIIEKSNTKEICELTNTINNLAETLENQEKLRKRLTSDVAHELRTPLATLQSHMEAMMDGVWEMSKERVESCYEETLRINRMVGELEKLTKYESENLILNKTEFNISELIQNIIRNFESEFSKNNIEITFCGDDILINADRDKISQVIVNLLSNALKYTVAGKTVGVNVKDNENLVQVSVEDSGIGISKEDLPNIFERFYRVDKSRNRQTGGSGIGLTITKAIVEAHRGKIEVKSIENVGTEFIIYLPKNDLL